jgi:protein-tyrosine-phosphatase
MLVLFRGGILIVAPLVDALGRRRVRWFSWAALVLSLAALAVTLGDVNGYRMSLIAGLDVVAYLASYFVRLRTMTRLAKTGVRHAGRRYFVEEQMVAAPALVLALVAFAIGEPAGEVRRGFTTFLASPALGAALLVGLCYATLCVFTTFIFLDSRENTFCIPMHCCSSMLSGVVASYALATFGGLAPPTPAQLAGSGILVMAILCLGFQVLEALWRAETPRAHADLQRLYLFVCSGNTSRSPMAQALCNDAIARLLGLRPGQLGDAPVRALSAGLTAQPGRPFAEAAVAALERRGVVPHAHASQEVTPGLVHRAELVFCMTDEQCRAVAARVPDAAAKIQRLDPDGDIEDPSGKDAAFFDRVSEQLQRAVQRRLRVLTA